MIGGYQRIDVALTNETQHIVRVYRHARLPLQPSRNQETANTTTIISADACWASTKPAFRSPAIVASTTSRSVCSDDENDDDDAMTS